MFVQRLQHVSTTVKDSSKSCLRESYSCFVNSEKKVGRCVQAVLRYELSTFGLCGKHNGAALLPNIHFILRQIYRIETVEF